MTTITLPTQDIRDKFSEVYPREEDNWLYASYQLGLRTVLIKGDNRVVVPMCDPETVTAFNCGCLDAWYMIQNRKDVQNSSVSVNPGKAIRSKSNSKKEEYEPGF